MTLTPDAVPAPTARPTRPDLWRLLVLGAVAVAAHWWVVTNTAVTARDSVGFVRYALALEDPGRAVAVNPAAPTTRLGVLREEAHPPGYPLAILAAVPVVRAFSDAPPAEQALAAAQVASAAAGVLVVFPVYWLARQLFDRTTGFWSALVLQLLPVFARNTSDGLSDGPFLLCASTSLAFGVWAIERRRIWPGLLACGAAAGLAYLVRPEGVLLPLAAGGTLLFRVGRLGFPRFACGGLAVAVGFFALAGPYMGVIGGLTNKPAFGGKSATLEPVAAAVGGGLFAESVPDEVTGRARLMAAIGLAGKEWLKTGHYGVAIYAVIGLACLLGRVWSEPKFWLPVCYTAGQLAAVIAVGFKQGYVSERHLLPVALLGVPVAVGGLPVWFGLWAKLPAIGWVFAWRWWPVAWSAVLAASCVPSLLSTRLHENRTGHKLAGAKLADAIAALPADLQDKVVVLDHYQWCQYFSGRALYAIPPDPPVTEQKVAFVVLELDKWGRPEVPDFDSERHAAALEYFLRPPEVVDKEWVYRWPEGVPPEQARIILVKVTPR